MATFEEIKKRAEEKKKNVKTFEDIKEAAKNSTKVYKTGTSTQDFQAWISGAVGLSNKLGSYFDTNSYKTPDDSLMEEISYYLDKAEEMSSFVRGNRSQIKDYEDVLSQITSMTSTLQQAIPSVRAASSYYSQFKDANDFNKKKAESDAYWEDYNSKLAFDTNAGQAELDALRSTFDEYSKLKAERDSQYSKWKNTYEQAGYLPDGAVDSDDAARKKVAALDAKLAEFGDMSGAENAISSKTQYLNQAKFIQKAQQLIDDAKADTQFDYYAQKGLDAEAEYSNLTGISSDGNIIAAYRGPSGKKEIGRYAMHGNAEVTRYYNLATNMTEEEFNIYNYYFAKYGVDKANEYLNCIEESLNGRAAAQLFKTLDGNTLLEFVAGFGTGLTGSVEKLENLFASGDDYIPKSSSQILDEMMREDLADAGAKLPDWLGGGSIGQLVFDLANTTGNMTPALALGKIPVVGPVIGAMVLGASSSGDAYADAIRSGYDKDQARGYSVMVGVSEAGLQYVLGGFSSLGGKASGNLISKLSSKVVSKISSGVGKAIASGGIKLAGKMVSEFSEEYLQEVLNPVFKNIAFNTNEDVELLSSEAVYAGILGALSAGLLEGVGSIGKEVKTYKAGKNVISEGKVQDLAKLGKTYSPETMAYKIASKVDANTDAYTLGQLVREAGAESLSQSNMAEIQKSLVRKNVAPSDAQAIAKWLNKAVEGRVLTKSQQAALENNPVISEVYRNVILNPKSTVNQRTQEATGSSNALRALAEEMAGVAQEEQAQQKKATTPEIDNMLRDRSLSPEQKKLLDQMAADASETIAMKTAEEQFGVSKDTSKPDNGSTINTKTGEYVDVVGISSSKKGELTLKVKKSDGSVETVNAKDLSFGKRSDSVLYSMIMDMGMSADTAESIINNFNPDDGVSVSKYALGVKEAYQYGKLGISAQEMSQKGFSAQLTEAQRSHAYKLGTVDAKAETSEAQKKVTESKGKDSKEKGNVKFEGDRSSLTNRQKVSLSVLEKLSDSLGVDFVIFESYEKGKNRYYKDENGNEVLAPNGFYDKKTGKIHIDINAGISGDGVILFTAAHELTHYIKQWSPEKFKVLADFLMEQYGKKGQSVDALVKEQIRKAANHDRELSYEAAFEEVVADSMESMLADGNVAQKLSLLKAKDKGLFEKIKAFFDSLVKKIKEVYEGLSPDSTEGKIVAEMKDSIERLQELFAEGLVDASANYQASDIANIDVDSKSVSPVMSERTWTASEYVTERDKTAKAISSSLGVDIKTAYKYIDDINSVARMIADDRVRLDYEPNLDPNATVLKANSDYKYYVDMSTLCAKRLLFTGTFDAIQKALPNRVFTSDEIVALREMMQKRGYEVACGICYVESTRREIGRITQEFIDRYKEAQKSGKPISRINSKGEEVALKINGQTFTADKAYTPTLGELNTTDIDIVKRDHREVYDAYLAFMNARGQAKPKLLETRAEYKGEILKHFKSRSAVEARNRAGGLRLQSFSDFEVAHLIDMMQIIMDMSRVGLKSQAYTKVPAFAEAFGNTGVKINLSLIAKGSGLDADGNLVFDDVEGINHEEAFKLRDKFSKNVGTILVGKSDAHIIAAMADPRIDYIIPFHKSSWKESLYDALGLTGYEDYTNDQHEEAIDKSKIKDYDPSEYWDFSKTGDENAQVYLQKCRDEGRIPKFSKFQGYPGYWKLLIDFKMYDNDGVGSPQEIVKPVFDNAANKKILDTYEGGHRNLPVAKDVVNDFVEQYKDSTDSDKVFSLRGTVEETADLVAVHNITPQQLLEAFNRNGLLAPSLAITNKGHTDFGEISLLFDKSTIDPSASAENKLYGADAWTPTQTKMKKNPKFDTNKTIKAVNNVKTRIGSKYVNELFDVSTKEFMEAIKKADGSIYDAYAHDLGMQAAYAKESKIISKIPTQKDGTVDTAELQKQLNAVLDTDSGWRQYKKWLANLSDTVITSYDTATNADILNNMAAQPSTAKTFKLSLNGELVVPAAEYSSIDDLRKNKNRLSENAEADAKKVASQFLSWAEGIDSDTKSVVDAINATFANRYSASDIVRSFNSKGIKISIEAARDLQVLYKQAVELPTQYFEAKPQREVGLEEIKAVVMPEQSSYDSDLSEIRAKLEQLGVKVVEYKNGSKESRVDALNSVDDVKFSYRDEAPNDFNPDGKTLDEQLDDVLATAESFDGRYLYIGRFTQKFIEMVKPYVDIKDLPVAMNYRDAYLSMQSKENGKYKGDGVNYHNLGKEGMKSAIESFDRPEQVLLSKNAGKIELVLEGVDKKGDRLLSIVALNTSTKNSKKFIEAHIVTSIYGRRSIERYVSKADGEGRLIYSKKEGPTQGIPQVQYEGNINANSSFDTTIAQKEQDVKYSERTSNQELSSMDDTALYIKNTKKANYIGMILNGTKTEETRSTRTLDAFIGKDFYVTDGKYVYGSVILGEPHKYTEEEFHKKENQKKHRVPKGDDYDIKQGGIKWAYPIESYTKFDKPKKLSDSKEYKNSFQARQVLYSDRDPDAVSTRNLLANSLESAAQNDIERNKLRLYKEKIDLIESEEKKLTDLRAEIKELSFAKGPRDSAKIRALQDEATRTANRINTYDKQLLTLEASKPLQNILQHEKDRAMKRQKQRDAENLRAYKEKAAATQRELLTRYQESRKNAVEGRHKTEMRHKIRNVVSELNKLLLNGTKERNVKLGLQPAVAAALEAVNMDTVAADERIAKLEAEMLKSRNPDKIQEISRKIDNIRSQGDVMASRLEALRRAYADIKASSDNIPEHYRSEAALIADKVDSVMQQVGNTPLRNMNLSQLEAVHDLYKMVLTTVRNANALFKQGKLEDLQHNVSEIMSEVSALPVRKEERLKVLNAVESFSWNEMIPVYAFERIGSKTFSKFFWETVKAQNTFATDINEAKEFASATREKYGYDKWDTQKVHEFKLADGRTFRLTLKHMMSIYAYSKRAQALDHMRTGGFFFNDKETFRKKGGVLSLVKSNEEGYCVNEAVLSAIVGEMTQDQLHYVDAMQEYLTKMGEKGNEVSRVLWGIDIFKEKVYFPLKSSKDFIFQANQTAQEASLKNDGMTKEVKPGASNPIVLEAFDDVWASHVNRMSQYHSFVLPIENLNKIHNYGTWAGTASVSVSTMMAARHGAAVNDYLTNFIRDLNGASSSQGASNPFISMVSKFKKTAVAASASVVVQQPTAILRAMAVMDAKYFVGKPSLNWSEIKKYAPIAIIKEIGGFDSGAGRQATQWLNEDTLRGTEKVMSKIDDYSMKGAAYGDQLGWGAIWSAVKNEIKATTDLEVGSEEFMQKAGERFTEVIVLTQVYDSTMSRSGYMRSKHDSVKMLTAFMGEPTVSINMMYNAAVQAKRGNITKRKATRVLSAVYASVVAASAMASMIYALRDDDDDESYLEKFAEAFGDKLISDINPLNMLPAVRDVMSILEGWDVERSDVAIFQDIYSAFDSLDSDSKSAWRKIEDFAGAIAAVFGVPLKNALRTGREIYNGINDIFDGISPSGVGDAFVRGITGENKDKGESLYNAIVDGDTERLELYKKGYKDDSSYELAVRNALRENDPRIQEAAQARKDGDTTKYASIVREIVKEGHFSQDTVVKAVNNALTKLNKGEGTSSGSEDGNKDASSIYYSSDLNQALEDGDTREALIIIEDMVKVKTENYINDGEKAKDAETKAKSSVKSSITSYWKPLYLEAYKKGNTTEMARIRNLLYSTKLYGTANEVVKTAQNWVKDSK